MSSALWQRAAVGRFLVNVIASKVTPLAVCTLLLFAPALGEEAGQPAAQAALQAVRNGTLLNQALVQAVKRSGPGVVNIVTIKYNADPYPDLDPRIPLPGQRGEFVPERAQEPQNQDPMRKTGIGSGMVIMVNGKTFILTNHHVVYGVDRIVVRTDDGREFDAQVKGWDPKVDVALLEPPESIRGKLTTLTLGNSDELEVGELVLAIGSPFGLQHSVTIGIVSAVGRYGQGIEEYEDFIQTDAAINRGNSGGPLLNVKGEVVGLNTAIRTTHMGGNVGIGFAIPMNMIMPVVEQLVKTGQVTRGWLGASVQNISDDLADAFNLADRNRNGVVVTKVIPGTPAEKGGLQQGDIILSIENIPVSNVNKLRNYVAAKLPDTKVRMNIIRHGRSMAITLSIGEAPSAAEEVRPVVQPRKTEGLGLVVQDVSKDIAAAMGLPAPTGALIAQAEAGSPAASARPVPLMQGDVIIELDHTPVKNAQSLRESLRKRTPGDSVLLLLCRKNNTLFTVLRIPDDAEKTAD